MAKNRCGWAGNDPLYMDYHDKEWGVPVHDDKELFEKIILDGAQAGLSWITILRKRDGYRRAFNSFDTGKIARYTEKDVARLMADEGIVRNRLKIISAIKNAKAYLEIQEKHGSFDKFLWRYVDYSPIQNSWKSLSQLPPSTKESDMMSKELKKAGFKFVGSTICYAFMQAVGMVNDHLVRCYRHGEIKKLSR
ncbi:MAG TPA: DNA-3-methyladenine glycosylase I [Lentisphaeria bacterium]|nr:MAG: DNA-3-methyladenine glycosylase [Lentisphaerae bacterium GWF2_50_93]HCE45391.1 DNA-3-methyladenine glycosylase I [Lentisphaeria bacterium]